MACGRGVITRAYYVRESQAGVAWLAESGFWGGPGGYGQPAFARVFFTKKLKQLIIGNWIDLPKGRSNLKSLSGEPRW